MRISLAPRPLVRAIQYAIAVHIKGGWYRPRYEIDLDRLSA